MIVFTVFVEAKRLTFHGQNNLERLNMDLARLSFCWRNTQDHLKNNLCLPGMQIIGQNTRTGINNRHLYARAYKLKHV